MLDMIQFGAQEIIFSCNEDDKDICNIEIPYATKLFLQELQTIKYLKLKK